MKFLTQARGSALGRIFAALPIVAVVLFIVAKLWLLASNLVPNFGG